MQCEHMVNRAQGTLLINRKHTHICTHYFGTLHPIHPHIRHQLFINEDRVPHIITLHYSLGKSCGKFYKCRKTRDQQRVYHLARKWALIGNWLASDTSCDEILISAGSVILKQQLHNTGSLGCNNYLANWKQSFLSELAGLFHGIPVHFWVISVWVLRGQRSYDFETLSWRWQLICVCLWVCRKWVDQRLILCVW